MEKLSPQYLADILQRSVWNVVESCGKAREDSGVGPDDFKLPAPAALPPLAPLDPLPLCRPLTDREAPTSLSSAAQHRQHSEERKSCLASLPVDDVTSWLCLLGSAAAVYVCLPECGCVYGRPINWKSRRVGKKGLSKPLLPPSFLFVFLSSHPVGRPVPLKPSPSGKGPEKTTRPLKPHIGQKEQNNPTNISGCLAGCAFFFLFVNNISFEFLAF